MERREVPAGLAGRARAAYEGARLRAALVRVWPVPVLAAVALFLCGARPAIGICAAALAVAVVGSRWRGGPLGRGVSPGLAAGAVPLLLPSLAIETATACSASCSLWCAWSCVVGGVLAGGVVGWRAAGFGEGRAGFLLSSAFVAGLTGAMGCFLAGAVGVSGMALGFLVAIAPIVLLAPQRA
jgi:hypothetical protein